MNKKSSFLFALLMFSAACANFTPMSDNISPPTISTASPSSTDLIVPTPTLRVFENKIDCKNSTSKLGHILFVKPSLVDTAGYYDLFIMNGKGCFPNLIMRQVSGSPAWSKDGEQIAVGCENNGFLCVLDSKTILENCADSQENEKTDCSPVILSKYTLPPNYSLYNISWSADKTELAVDGYDSETSKYSIRILNLSSNSEWKILVQRDWALNLDWSPIDNSRLVYSGLTLGKTDGQGITDLAVGLHPQWSPDGKRIAFVKASDENIKEPYSKEPFGIAVTSPNEKTWSWLYKPASRDNYYYPPQNIFLNMSGNMRVLSWSPDGSYLAFVSLYRHDYDSQIFRLNIATGEVVVLTSDFISPQGAKYSFAPAWGP